MKKTWFHGLALSLGITTIPSVASAQYTVSGNKGLSASSFQLPPLPAPPQRAPKAYGRFTGYYQDGPVGNGSGEHVHVPAPNQPMPPQPHQGVQPSQYQSDPYSIGASPNYENIQGASTTSSNCPGCAAGNCATHGVGTGRAGGAYHSNGGYGGGSYGGPGYGNGAAYGSAGGYSVGPAGNVTGSGQMGMGGVGPGMPSGGGVVGSGGPGYGGPGFGGGAINGGMGPGPVGPGPGVGMGPGMGPAPGAGGGPIASGPMYDSGPVYGGGGGGVVYEGGGFGGPVYGGAAGPVLAGPAVGGPAFASSSFGGSFVDDGSCGGFGPDIGFAPAIVAPSPWIFGASGLLFNRVDDYPVRLTSDSNMPTYPLLSTRDAAMQASGGFQGSVGRYFGCGRYAMVATYWGIFSDPRSVTIMPPAGGNLRSDLPFTLRRPNDTAVPGMPYGIGMPGQHVYDWYDGAAAHRLVRDQDIHNVELNFFSFALGGGARQAYAVSRCYSGYGGGYGYGGAYGYGGGLGGGGFGGGHGGGFGGGRFGGHGGGGYGAGYGACGDSCGDPCGNSCDPCATACAPSGGSGPTGPFAPWYGAQCSKLRLNLYGGVRYFRFRDDLEFATSETDVYFGSGADDFYYRNNVTNDLVGFQLGSQGTWCLGSRFNLFGGTAFGLYNNRIQTETTAGTATQAATIMSSNAFNGRPYSYMNTLNDVAFLGEGTIGTGICITRGWTMNLGYRVVGVSGLATAVGQIPRDFSNGDDVNRIHNDRSLILHGALFGANYNF